MRHEGMRHEGMRHEGMRHHILRDVRQLTPRHPVAFSATLHPSLSEKRGVGGELQIGNRCKA